MPITPEQLTEARRNTGGAILALAQHKQELEQVRKDPDSTAENIMSAAQAFRQSEAHVKTAMHAEQELYEKALREKRADENLAELLSPKDPN